MKTKKYAGNLEVYIHIPFCVKKCDYCDFLSGTYDENMQTSYVTALCREIHYLGRQMREYKVSTVFIGGGTPSWLNAKETVRIMHALRQSFALEKDAEISIECNPGTVTTEKFQIYRELGINRISIGLQSANDEELQMLGRIHTFDRFLHMYELARQHGFDNINVDIMTGLPGQTLDKLHHTLQQVLRLKPEHISAYALMIEKGTPFYDRYKFDDVKQHAGMATEYLPNEDEEYQLYKMTQHTLVENGYEQYEISNYARKGKRCRHNQGYWKRENYLGVGIGAASLIEETRYSNVRDIYDYIDIVNGQIEQEPRTRYSPLWETTEEITRKAAMEEFMFLGLRMNEGISRQEFEQKFGVTVEAIYAPVIERLKTEELLCSEAGRIYLTERGSDISNYTLAEFLLD